MVSVGLELQLFDWMHTMVGYKPDETIYHTMILLLANARRMDVAEAIFEGLVKEGMEQRHQEYTVLITGYVRSGSLQRAVTILERMKKAGICPQVSAYNILIDGCSKSAKGFCLANFAFVVSCVNFVLLIGARSRRFSVSIFSSY